MHMVEGYLPLHWWIIWFVLALIFIVIGIRQMIRVISEVPESKKILGISGLMMFVLQFFGRGFVTGTTSSAYGNALTGSIFGPAISSVIAAIVLFLQAILLGYGGLTTLGANIISIGVVGPFAAYFVYDLFRKHNISPFIAIVVASFLSGICTALTGAVQLGLVYGDIWKFIVLTMISQILFIFVDVVVTLVVFAFIYTSFKDSNIFSSDFKEFLKFR